MLQRNALGGARRSRGVHDTGEVVGSGWHGLDWVLRAQHDELVDAVNGQVGVGLLQARDMCRVDVVLGVVDDVVDLFGLLQRIDDVEEKVGVKEDGVGASGHQRVLQSLLAQGIVGRDDGHRL